MQVNSDVCVSVTWKEGNKQLDLQSGSTVADVIKNLGLNVSAQIVLRDNRPIPIDEKIDDGDELRIIETFSGG